MPERDRLVGTHLTASRAVAPRLRGTVSPMVVGLRVARAVLLAGIVGAAGCRTPATQVDLVIDTGCAPQDRRVTLRVLDTDADAGDLVIPVSSWPVRRTLVPRGGDASRAWHVEVVLQDTVTGAELARLDPGGRYSAGATVEVPVALSDPRCATSDAGALDAGERDASAPEDATVHDGGAEDASGLDAPSPDAFFRDAAGLRDAGTRTTTGLLLAYPFDEAAGATVRECVVGANVTMDTGADYAWGDGLVLRTGWGRSPALPVELLRAMQDAFSVEGWIEIDPSSTFEPASVSSGSNDRVVGFYDTESYYNTLRVAVGGGLVDPLYADAGGMLDAGSRVTDARYVELLGGVTTSLTGDSYARPLFAARAPRTGPVHFVYAYEGGPSTGTDRLYVSGAEVPEVRWIPAPTAPPRRGLAQASARDAVSATTRVYLGNHPSYGAGPVESPPSTETQFAGTYHLLAIYGRVLTAGEVAHHAALGPGADPCP